MLFVFFQGLSNSETGSDAESVASNGREAATEQPSSPPPPISQQVEEKDEIELILQEKEEMIKYFKVCVLCM